MLLSWSINVNKSTLNLKAPNTIFWEVFSGAQEFSASGNVELNPRVPCTPFFGVQLGGGGGLGLAPGDGQGLTPRPALPR